MFYIIIYIKWLPSLWDSTFFFLIHIPILGLFLFLLNISQFTNTTVYQTKLTHLKYNNPWFLFLNDHFIAPCYRTSVKLMKRLLGFCITNDMTWKYTDNVEKLCKLFFLNIVPNKQITFNCSIINCFSFMTFYLVKNAGHVYEEILKQCLISISTVLYWYKYICVFI